MIYILTNISKTKNNCRLHLSKRFRIATLIPHLTYFVHKMEMYHISIQSDHLIESYRVHRYDKNTKKCNLNREDDSCYS